MLLKTRKSRLATDTKAEFTEVNKYFAEGAYRLARGF